MAEEPKNNGEKRERDPATGQFVEGNSGGPGKPPGSLSITAAIKSKLKEVPQGQQKEYLAILVDKIVHKALIEGDDRMIEAIWNYVDGLPKAKFEGEVTFPAPIYGGKSVQGDDGAKKAV